MFVRLLFGSNTLCLSDLFYLGYDGRGKTSVFLNSVQATICHHTFAVTPNTLTLSRFLTDKWRTTSAKSRKGEFAVNKLVVVLVIFKNRFKLTINRKTSETIPPDSSL